jgi:hypothetical protein
LYRLATGYMVRISNPSGWTRFSISIQPGPDSLHSLLSNRYQFWFPGVKGAALGVNHLPNPHLTLCRSTIRAVSLPSVCERLACYGTAIITYLLKKEPMGNLRCGLCPQGTWEVRLRLKFFQTLV